MEEIDLVKSAIDARSKAHTPYSHFNVGAALLTKDRKSVYWVQCRMF